MGCNKRNNTCLFFYNGQCLPWQAVLKALGNVFLDTDLLPANNIRLYSRPWVKFFLNLLYNVCILSLRLKLSLTCSFNCYVFKDHNIFFSSIKTICKPTFICSNTHTLSLNITQLNGISTRQITIYYMYMYTENTELSVFEKTSSS